MSDIECPKGFRPSKSVNNPGMCSKRAKEKRTEGYIFYEKKKTPAGRKCRKGLSRSASKRKPGYCSKRATRTVYKQVTVYAPPLNAAQVEYLGTRVADAVVAAVAAEGAQGDLLGAIGTNVEAGNGGLPPGAADLIANAAADQGAVAATLGAIPQVPVAAVQATTQTFLGALGALVGFGAKPIEKVAKSPEVAEAMAQVAARMTPERAAKVMTAAVEAGAPTVAADVAAGNPAAVPLVDAAVAAAAEQAGLKYGIYGVEGFQKGMKYVQLPDGRIVFSTPKYNDEIDRPYFINAKKFQGTKDKSRQSGREYVRTTGSQKEIYQQVKEIFKELVAQAQG